LEINEAFQNLKLALSAKIGWFIWYKISKKQVLLFCWV